VSPNLWENSLEKTGVTRASLASAYVIRASGTGLDGVDEGLLGSSQLAQTILPPTTTAWCGSFSPNMDVSCREYPVRRSSTAFTDIWLVVPTSPEPGLDGGWWCPQALSLRPVNFLR